MANFIYSKAKQDILNGVIDFSSNTFAVAFLKTSYIPIQETEHYLSDILNADFVYKRADISNVTNILGVIDASNIIVEQYSGEPFASIVMYKVGSTDQNSNLIFFINDSVGLPFSGALEPLLLLVEWSNLSSKILSL